MRHCCCFLQAFMCQPGTCQSAGCFVAPWVDRQPMGRRAESKGALAASSVHQLLVRHPTRQHCVIAHAGIPRLICRPRPGPTGWDSAAMCWSCGWQPPTA